MPLPHVPGKPSTRSLLRRYPIIAKRLASMQKTERLRRLGVADLAQHRAHRIGRLLDRLYDGRRTPPPTAAAAAAVPGSRYMRVHLDSEPSAGILRPGETHVLHRDAKPRVRPHSATPAARTRRSHQHGECLVDDPDGQRLWCRTCAAAYLGITSKTLANWAYEASPGPKVRGRKGAPRYRKSDLDRWSESRW